ncbi:MAG: GNAT family N-acetyltransferase [Hyphomicrobiaceae bacterium]|nr:GNAT family N-acetyltransferase [Hyphomicrobiaceae bacterium]
MPDQTYLTKRLLLRPPKPADAADVYRNIADWDVVRMIARPPWPYPRSLADEFVRTSSASVIEYKGEVIGAVGIAARSHGHNLGFWLGKRYWGQGFMTEAAAALITAFFADVGDVALNSSYLADNPASWRVQQKLGFVQTGPCVLQIASRDAELPGVKTVLTRAEFQAAMLGQASSGK